MYTLIVKGFSEDMTRCGAGFETQRLEFEDDAGVIEFLKAVEQATLDDATFDGSLVIQGQGWHLEVRKEVGGLFLSDRNNLNLQHLKIRPEAVFGAVEAEEEAGEASPADRGAGQRPGKNATLPLVAIIIVVTLVIQGTLFMQAGNPFPSTRLAYVEDVEAAQDLRARHSGEYHGTAPGDPIGLRLGLDGRFALLDGGGRAPTAQGPAPLFPYAEGTYRFGYEGEQLLVELDGGDLVDVLSETRLNYYGYTLEKVSNPEGGTPDA